MTPERWQAVRELLAGALERAPGERRAFLNEACGADAALRLEVESLLEEGEGATGFLEPRLSQVAAVPATLHDVAHVLQGPLSSTYHIEREVGRGGMAAVYLARDLRHKRLVALKVLDPELGAAVGPERFRREIETAAGLQHPHILPIHDSGEAGGLLYYVMPFVEGESLRERLRREHQLPLEGAVHVAREIAEALDYAHRRNIIHRDVKPENILLSDGNALLADFGIAKALGEAGGERLTGTGLSLGTPAYMSPEQASGTRELDGRSDIYSLACVLYEMIAGEPPFTGSTPQATINRRFVQPPTPLRRLRAAVSEPMDRVVLRLGARAGRPLLQSSRVCECSQRRTRSPDGKHADHGSRAARGSGTAFPARLEVASEQAGAPARSRDAARSECCRLGTALALQGRVPGAGSESRRSCALRCARPLAPAVAQRPGGRALSCPPRGRATPHRATEHCCAALARPGRTGFGRCARPRDWGGACRLRQRHPLGQRLVRLAATVLDVARERALGGVEVRGPLSYMDRLADSLAVSLIRQLGRTRPIGAVPHSGIHARSPPALKASGAGDQTP